MNVTHLLTPGVEYGARGIVASLIHYYLYAKSVPQDIPRAIDYCHQVIEYDGALLDPRTLVPHPLIENGDPFRD